MKKIAFFLFIVFGFFQNILSGQDRDTYNLFLKYYEFNKSGNFIKAEEALLLVLNPKNNASAEYVSAAYNNLGVLSLTFGNYNKALEYNLKAESFINKKDQISQDLADIYNNRGYILIIKKTFDVAIEYLDKSIRIYQNLDTQNKNVLSNLSSAYINISIAFLETKNYSLALHYLEKNVELNLKYNLSGLSLTYLNIAKTYVKNKNLLKADVFYNKSISSFILEFGDNYYRLAEAYFDYGLFLWSEGKIAEALDSHKKALSICLKNYGEKHTLTSLSYRHIGDDFIIQNKLDSALYYYQRSLIAVVKNFNNPDIFSNPQIDSTLFDIRLLDNLKRKAQALELFAGNQNDQAMKLKAMIKSLETMDLALQLIDRIRNNYMSEESRIYLAENEKETYLFAAHLAYSLFSTTHADSLGRKMYSIAQKSKAAVLRNEISGN